jgi:antirestriction protein ArdC
MKRDLYAEVSARIVAELEAGAAPWVKPWSASPGANTPCNAVSNRPYSGCNVVLLWMAQAAGYRTPRFLTFKQALELGGNVRKGERGTKVYFVKQLQVRDQGADDSSSTRLIPMMREYTVFNVDQCENLPDSVKTGKPMPFAIPTRATSLPTRFCTQLVQTSARDTAKPATSRAEILSRCRHTLGSRARITSTTWRSTN